MHSIYKVNTPVSLPLRSRSFQKAPLVPVSPQPSRVTTTLASNSMDSLCPFWTLYNRDSTPYSIVLLAPLAQNGVCETHPSTCVWLPTGHYCCRGLLVQTLHSALTYSAIGRRLGSFQSLTSMNMMLFTSQGVDLHPLTSSFLLRIYPGVPILGHRVFKCSALEKMASFPKCFYQILSTQ